MSDDKTHECFMCMCLRMIHLLTPCSNRVSITHSNTHMHVQTMRSSVRAYMVRHAQVYMHVHGLNKPLLHTALFPFNNKSCECLAEALLGAVRAIGCEWRPGELHTCLDLHASMVSFLHSDNHL